MELERIRKKEILEFLKVAAGFVAADREVEMCFNGFDSCLKV